MNRFFDQFSKLPIPVKLAAMAIVVIVTFAINHLFFFKPKKVELEAKKAQKSQLESKYVENKLIADNLNKFQEEVNLLEDQLREAFSLLPNEADVHALYRQLFIEAEKSNVQMVSFRPAGTGKRGFYNDLSLDVTMTGSYHRIAEFIDRIGKLDRIINVSNIVFTRISQVANLDSDTEVTLKITTYMFGGGR